MAKQLFLNCNNIETAQKTDDYPWGFRLRCTKFWYVESSPKKGWRAVSQTIDPKNGRLCAPKKGTYHALPIYVTQDENDYFGFIYTPTSLTGWDNEKGEKTFPAQDFINEYWEFLPAEHQKQLWIYYNLYFKYNPNSCFGFTLKFPDGRELVGDKQVEYKVTVREYNFGDKE